MKQNFANYWFETGTPSFIIDLMKNQYEDIIDLEEIELKASSIGPFEMDDLPVIPLLFQAGYLTIAHHRRLQISEDQWEDLYTLKFPNLEVSQAFKKYLLAALSQTSFRRADSSLTDLAIALQKNDIPSFFLALQSLFAHIPYQLHIPKESYYHSMFQLIESFLNYEAQSEVVTNKGRIDLVMITKKNIYIFEVKLDGTAQEALKQIEHRKYYERYLLEKKKIVLIGVSFNRLNNLLELEYKMSELHHS